MLLRWLRSRVETISECTSVLRGVGYSEGRDGGSVG